MTTQSRLSTFIATLAVTVGFASLLAGEEPNRAVESRAANAPRADATLPPAFEATPPSSSGQLPIGISRIPAVAPPPAFRPPNTSGQAFSAPAVHIESAVVTPFPNTQATAPANAVLPAAYGQWLGQSDPNRSIPSEHSMNPPGPVRVSPQSLLPLNANGTNIGPIRVATNEGIFRSPADTTPDPSDDNDSWKDESWKNESWKGAWQGDSWHGSVLKKPDRLLPVRAAQYTKPAPWQAWWKQRLGTQTLTSSRAMPVRLEQLMELALVNSPAINIARLDVAIEREGIPEQLGRFDWNAFVEKLWTDTDEATGSELQAGSGEFRLIEEDLRSEAGFRRTNQYGGQFEIGQALQIRDSNSQFFDPSNQGLSRLTLRYNQPLLRESGVLVNMGRVYIAEHLAEASQGDSRAAIRDLLFEVATRYWALYRERGNVIIREALYKSALEMLEEIKKRDKIDADRRLIVLAEATVTLRRANLLQSQTALRAAQNELAFFVSVPRWEGDMELVPQDIPFETYFTADEQQEIQVALTRRSEVHAAIQRIQASAVQKSIAENDLLPRLALRLSLSAAGINGDYDIAESFTDQFSKGAPTYAVGFSFEQPLRNRTARARDRRAALEVARFTAQLDEASDIVKVEVKNAVTQVNGTFAQLQQFAAAADKAQEEIAVITRRRWLFPDLNGITTLYLREILDAQSRLGAAEQQYLDAQTRYSLAILDLRRAKGTLMSEDPLNSACLPTNGIPMIGN